MTPLTLPRLGWGDSHATRHALIVHGLGSSAQTGWQLGSGLAEAGWYATAVDLRGHGVAPRAPRYRISDFATDLVHTQPEHGGAWDVVIGHSIGAAAAVVAQAGAPKWARKLILLDPALALGAERKELVRTGQLYGHDRLTEDEVAADNPHWHPLDVELRVWSNRAASRFALEHAVIDNPHWDTTEQARSIAVSTLVVGGDPAVDSLFTGEHAEAVLASQPLMTHVVIAGAGHSVHRDKPEETLSHMMRFLV